MAEETKPKDITTDLEKLKAELEEARLAHAAEVEKNKTLTDALDSAGQPNSVEGKYKHKTGTFRFKDGAHMTRNLDGVPIPTAELIKIANKPDYKPTMKSLSDYPVLGTITHESAKELLDHLVTIRYGLIEEIKK